MKRLVIGTRKSELALWQAKWVRERLIEAHPGLEVELAETDTAGDRDLATPLPLVDGKGVFTAEIEEGLRDGTIDLAVHSLKDLPTELPEGFEIGAYCMRHDPRDGFLGKDGMTLADLPEGARIGTSSLRRAAQVHRVRPDVECVSIRGNLATRWRKLQEDEGMAGIILAVAGVARLGWRDRITEYLAPDMVMPAAGQGVIAVEVAAGRDDAAALVEGVKDGTVDAIVTDHAPHNDFEKNAEFELAPFGMIGLETSLALVITNLVAPGIISWERAVELMAAKPREILRVERVALEPGATADLTVIDPDAAWTVDAADFLSKAVNSGFIGVELTGRATDVYVGGYATLEDGAIVE